MDVISLKLDPNMLKNIDSILGKHNYSTRTEFIRDAVREKLEELQQKEAYTKFKAMKGKAPRKINDEEFEKNREEAGKEILKKYNLL